MGRVDSPLRDRVIFNVGSRRSGTYWLQRIVTAHPAVGSVPSETHLLSHGIAPLLERFQHEDRDSPQVGVVYADRERLIDAVRHLCDEVFSEFMDADQSRIAERTPLHVLHVGMIEEIYPDAKFVHIIRDGRDVARSIATQNWGPTDIAGAAREWRESVDAGRGAGLSGDRYLEVRYESLLASPEPEIGRLYGWLGLPTSPDDLAYPLAESARQENVDRFGMGGIATQKWLSVFDARDLATFNEVAGDLLEELSYPPPPSAWAPKRRSSRRGRIAGAIASRLRG